MKYFVKMKTKRMRNLFFAVSITAVSALGCSKSSEPGRKRESAEWKTETLAAGSVHYSLSGYYEPTNSNQNINVLEIDINNPDYDLSVNFISRDSLSSFVKTIPNAFVAINGTYGEAINGNRVSFIKSNGSVKTRVTLPGDDLRFYKHEGAFYFDNESRTSGIQYGTDAIYNAWAYPQILSGAPVLIDDFAAVGETFVNPNAAIGTLPDEHPDKMQAVRHPRTAIAITQQGKILLITVDGRRTQAAGMSAKELTQFLKSKFNPRYALNIDGGGSTTMWIKDSEASATGVVNYPTDNGKFDHYGQRELNNCIVITRK